jgi:protein-L-isoaspartate(D-aspartate) O-methyltransferase
MESLTHSDVSTLSEILIGELKAKGHLVSPPIEAAFRAVPRHLFVPSASLEEAYADRSIPTKRLDDQVVSSSSQPAIMAIMLEQLGLEPGHKVLEIGAGTGYNAALMAHLVGETGQVISVDIDQDIVDTAHEHLAVASFDRVQVVCADGGHGYAEAAPYDRIILTVGAWDITPAWWEQLKPGGRLVLPLAIRGGQKSIAFERRADHLLSLSVKDCGFMPLRGVFAAPPVSQVQLGPDPGLFLEVEATRPIDTEAVYRWLIGPSQDWPTDVAVSVCERLSGLRLWLALPESDVGILLAKGDMVDRGLVPPLVGLGGEWKSVSTSVLLGETGLVALMRPPGQPAPLIDINEFHIASNSFTLFVRQFGRAEDLAQRLIEQVKAWDEASRPASENLLIRAYPKWAGYTRSVDDLVVEKQWTWLVLGWQRGP